MNQFYDRNLKLLKEGDHVTTQFCIGPYGQVRKLSGTIVSLDEYGGIVLELDGNTRPFTEYGRYGSMNYKKGDTYYVAGAFSWDFEKKVLVGYHKHRDFEHGHESFCELDEACKNMP